MKKCLHTSDIRHAEKMWIAYGGVITNVRRTGEVRYIHPMFIRPLTANGRRNDVAGKLMSRINQARSACSLKPSINESIKSKRRCL